jgi:hypothetical protein
MSGRALERLLRAAPPRPDRRAQRWSEIVRHAVAHPELYPPIRAGEVPSLPLDVHRLRVLAHDPDAAAREVAHALAVERTARRTERIDRAERASAPTSTSAPRPRPAPRTDATVARGLAEASGLPLGIAAELVRIHGWDLTPAQARHLHRRRTA